MSIDESTAPSATPQRPPDGEPDPAPAARQGAWALLRPVVLRLHFYAGVFVAPFIVVAAVTGLLYVWMPQIEEIVYSEELTAPAGEERLALSDQVAAATEAAPDRTLHAVRPGTEPGKTTRVLFEAPELDSSSYRHAVFVDPYTGEVQGELASYGHSGALPVRAWLSEFHRHLHLGEPGRLYSELAASWLWVVAGGGVLLWVARRRQRRVRGVLAPDLWASGRPRTRSWHGAVGVWVLVGLFVLSATGLTWSTYAGANVATVRESFDWVTPSLASAETPPEHADHEGHGDGGHDAAGHTADIGLDQVYAEAEQAGVDGEVEVVVPSQEQGVYTVTQLRSHWPTQRDAVAVDPASGEVVEELRFADYSVAAKLSRWGIDAHMGLLFGVANQVVLTAVALGAIVLAVLGYRMWWQRRPTSGTAWAFGRPIPRGAWRALPVPYRLPIVACAVAVGVFLPVLGVSLLAFLALDIVLAWVARRREASATRTA